MVSIICPIYNEERYIEKCIQSVLSQNIPAEDWELLLIDGNSKDKTLTLILPYVEQYPNIRLIENPKRTAPYAMNIGIQAAKGEYICRIDAHASYPADYVSTLLRYSKALPNAANVGTVCQTKPRNEKRAAKAISAVLSNRFGVGNSTFRIGINEVVESDTVPFGFFKKEIFERVGLYNEHLKRNQDIELNKRILNNGGKVYLIPDTYCTYYARATYASLAKNNYENGKWNILTIYYTHDIKSLSIRHFIPLLFVLSLSIPLFLMPLWFPIIGTSMLSLCAYCVLISSVSAKEAYSQRLDFLALLIAFMVLHFSYGIGSLFGIFQLPFVKFR